MCASPCIGSHAPLFWYGIMFPVEPPTRITAFRPLVASGAQVLGCIEDARRPRADAPGFVSVTEVGDDEMMVIGRFRVQVAGSSYVKTTPTTAPAMAPPTDRMPAADSVMPAGSWAPLEETPNVPPRLTLLGSVVAK